MQTSLGIRIFAGWIGLAVLATASLSAQFEPSPDHYDFPNAEPFPQTKNVSKTASTQYDASFVLPYAVECKGTNLPPGKYWVSLLSDGKMGQAKLKGKGQEFGLSGLVRQPDQSRKEDAVIVELTGNIRQLTAIHIAALDLVFDSVRQNLPANESKQLDSVALTPSRR